MYNGQDFILVCGGTSKVGHFHLDFEEVEVYCLFLFWVLIFGENNGLQYYRKCFNLIKKKSVLVKILQELIGSLLQGVRNWNRFLREAVDAASMAEYKAGLDGELSNLV